MKSLILTIFLLLISLNGYQEVYNPEIRVYAFGDIKVLYQILIKQYGFEMIWFEPNYYVCDSNGHFCKRHYLAVIREY